MTLRQCIFHETKSDDNADDDDGVYTANRAANILHIDNRVLYIGACFYMHEETKSKCAG
jgi:hypothetical protein